MTDPLATIGDMRGELNGAGLGGLLDRFPDATGSIQIDGPSGPAQVFLRHGHIYWATSPAPRAQLGQRLLGAGFIDDDQLSAALDHQSSVSPRPRLGNVLVERGLVSGDVIRVFVQEQVLDALLEIASWEHGGFEFLEGDAASEETPVLLPGHHITTEVERRQREWDEISTVVPSLDHIPDFAEESTTQAALEPDEFTLMTNIDGRRSVRELALHLGYNEYEAARLVYGLSILGIVELKDPVGDSQRTSVSMDIARGLEEAIFGYGFGEPEEAAAVPPAEPTAAVAEPDIGADVAAGDDLTRALQDAIATVHARGGEDEPHAAPPSQTAPPVSRTPTETDERLLLPDDDLEPAVWTFLIEPEDGEDVDDAVAAAEHAVSEEPAAAATTDAELAEAPPVEEPQVGPVATSEPPEPVELAEPQVIEREDEEEPEPFVAELPAAETDEPTAASAARRELTSLLGDLNDIEESTRDEATEEQPAPAAQETDDEAAGEVDEEGAEPDREEVSEFLRELSRLADDDEPSPPRPKPPPPSSPPRQEPQPPSKREDDQQKGGFRRLFGGR